MMARFQTSALVTDAPLLLLLIVSQVGSTPQLFGTGQQICNYQYAVPYGGNCVTYGPALEQKVEAVQRDVDRVKLRFVTDTSVLREELAKLSQQSSGADTRLQDLGSGLRAVQAALASIQAAPAVSSSSSGGSTGTSATALAMLEQLVKTTQAKLTQDMLKLENQMRQMQSGLQAEIMGNGVQESRVDQALQAQLRQHETDLTTVMQHIQQLDQRVNSLERVTHSPTTIATPFFTTSSPSHTSSAATTTTTTTTTALPTTTSTKKTTAASTTGATTPSSLQVQQLEQDLQKLESRLATLENEYQADVPQLKSNITFLKHLTANHSLDLSSVKLELEQLDQISLPQLQQQATTTYQALGLFSQRFDREFPPLVSQVQTLAGNISTIGPQLSVLGSRVMTETMKMHGYEQTLHDLDNKLAVLETELQKNGITTPAATTTKPLVPTPRATFIIPPRRTTTPSSG